MHVHYVPRSLDIGDLTLTDTDSLYLVVFEDEKYPVYPDKRQAAT